MSMQLVATENGRPQATAQTRLKEVIRPHAQSDDEPLLHAARLVLPQALLRQYNELPDYGARRATNSSCQQEVCPLYPGSEEFNEPQRRSIKRGVTHPVRYATAP